MKNFVVAILWTSFAAAVQAADPSPPVPASSPPVPASGGAVPARAMAPSATPTAPGAATAARASGITVIRPWVRSTRPGQQNAAGYLEVRSRTPDRLVGVKPSPDSAARAEMHTMRIDGDLMVMREVDALPVPAGRNLVLAPGGNHLMLVGLKRPLAARDSVAAVLRFEKAGDVPVRLEVRDMPPAAGTPGGTDAASRTGGAGR